MKRHPTPSATATRQTRSATVPSTRWKKINPATTSATTTIAETAICAPGGFPTPVSAHRNPSMTPAIGFSPYNQRHRSGTSELGYATGDASIQNCTTNGMIDATSRYKAFSAEVQSPTPSAVATASSKNTGSSNTVAGGWIPKLSVKIIITANPIAKSSSPEHTAARGRNSRGKYNWGMTC